MNKKSEKPCERCGSERIVSKTWTKTIKTFDGKSTLIFEQVICTNRECQIRFEKAAKAEKQKQNEIKRKKEELELKRKENITSANQKRRAAIGN